MYLAEFSQDGDIIGGKVAMYVGEFSDEVITDDAKEIISIEDMTREEANKLINYNIANMDRVALCEGAMSIDVNDIELKPIGNGNGVMASALVNLNYDGIKFNTGIAEFNFDLLGKYFSNATKTFGNDNGNVKVLSYGAIDNAKLKRFDILLVQDDKTSNTKYVWLLKNCYTEPSQSFNTDANSVMVYNYSFVVTRKSRFETPVYIIKIKGD